MNTKDTELIAILKEHRESLEIRLAEQLVRGRAENERAEKLMKRLEKMRDELIGLMNAVKREHKRCSLRECPDCDAVTRARKMLSEFRWE